MTHWSKHTNTNSSRGGRRDRLIREQEHDPYRARSKPPEPSVCADCGAVFHRGRWQWGESPPDAHETQCPACARTRSRVPAGFLTLTGRFLQAHQEEILALARNLEEREQREHPLKRIMAIEPQDSRIEITFTDPHLARGVGEAMHRAYQGDLRYEYTEGENMLRVTWHRDE